MTGPKGARDEQPRGDRGDIHTATPGEDAPVYLKSRTAQLEDVSAVKTQAESWVDSCLTQPRSTVYRTQFKTAEANKITRGTQFRAPEVNCTQRES